MNLIWLEGDQVAGVFTSLFLAFAEIAVQA
jgi:hypothetical protein